MNGGPSQMDLFDPKPALDRLHGTSHFNRIAGEIENVKDAGALMRSPFQFRRHGRAGVWVSEVMPHLARLAGHWARHLDRAGRPDAAEAARRALATYCHALLNSAEFLYVD